MIRTSDRQIRNLLLYPAELRGRHFFDSSNHISRSSIFRRHGCDGDECTIGAQNAALTGSDATLEPADIHVVDCVKTKG